jgi:hypothetical protein
MERSGKLREVTHDQIELGRFDAEVPVGKVARIAPGPGTHEFDPGDGGVLPQYAGDRTDDIHGSIVA